MNGKANQIALFIHSSLDTKKRKTVFNDIWNEYYPKLTVYLKTTYSLPDTEDIVQDILFKVYNNLYRYNPIYSFNTWIYSIARNSAVDSLRKNLVSSKVLTELKSETKCKTINNNETPEELCLNREVETEIAEWIRNLPDREKQVSFLKFYEGLTYKEISKIINIPVGTIKYLVHNIKKNIETHYNEQYGEYHES